MMLARRLLPELLAGLLVLACVVPGGGDGAGPGRPVALEPEAGAPAWVAPASVIPVPVPGPGPAPGPVPAPDPGPAPSAPEAQPASIPEPLYTYDDLTGDVQRLAAQHPDLARLRTLGQTAYGRQIWALGLGTGPAAVLIVGAHHGSEWMTAQLTATMAEDYAQAADADIREKATVWFIPMLNPDGVTISQTGLAAFPPEAHAKLRAWNNGSDDFRGWKANAEGIDLNRQYPADWAHIVASPPGPTFSHFKGDEPLVAPEARALHDFTLELNPEIVLAYHSAGRVIYWHFHTWPEHVERDRRIAEQLAGLTGYALMPPEANPSGGGYKDWFVQTVGRPGFTQEIGVYTDGGPLPAEAFAEEWERNRGVGLAMAQEAIRLYEERGAR
ncbi:MAG TPA: M14 family zinc carboxypeptidase [Symbiobacteriaceae bacterium]|nr:M14 family zinc carboxypeptidase [Symbiobacteriaceae bacterium]